MVLVFSHVYVCICVCVYVCVCVHVWVFCALPSQYFAADGESQNESKKKKKKTKQQKKLGEKIVLICQVQRGKRKFVTSISGIDAFGLDLKDCSKKMSKRFACSASIVKCTPPPNEIALQGDVQHEVAEFCVDKLKIPKEFVYFLDAKKKKRTKAF